ncbi:MAG: hypothetical protein RSG52_06750 [Terrisporobacter sp.]|uniref:hypothetical protein n=1 Tax=Terrisporobacter sp. TaxID=1965305 RepID=UPI002FCB20B5
MNKKFIKVSLIICVPLILLIGIFSMMTNSMEEDMGHEKIQITYKGYKEEKYNYTVSVIIKNNSKSIASLGETQLSFEYEGSGENIGEFYIKGEEEDIWDDNKVMGIDPGKEEELIFKIPKGIKINKEDYNMNKLLISYDISFFKFRAGKNSLVLGTSQMGGTETLEK